MKTPNELETKIARRVTRVALRPSTDVLLKNWREQISAAFPTFNPFDRNLISWALEKNPVLSKKDIQEIKGRFFDKIQEMDQLLKQLKEAKSQGDQSLVVSLLETLHPKKKSSKTISPPK